MGDNEIESPLEGVTLEIKRAGDGKVDVGRSRARLRTERRSSTTPPRTSSTASSPRAT
jgi:hypothetical protein